MKKILMLGSSLTVLAMPQAAWASGLELAASPLTPTPDVSFPASPVNSPELLAQTPVAPVSDITSLQSGSNPVKPAPATKVNSVSNLLLEAEGGAAPQVTSVSQLSDVRPTDWAFQALQSLVEKYGCIAGYPDGTFRGNRAATRFELAAALNACLDVISDRFATKEDLATVRKLQEELAAELATLRGRVDGLEARTAKLEAQQFSTTTKLSGEAIFQATQYASGDRPVPAGFPQGFNGDVGDNLFVNGRSTLNLLTSFSGKDLLITSLQAGNYPTNTTGLPAGFPGTLAPQVTQVGSNNTFSLYTLQYRFPVLNDKVTIFATAVGGELADFVDTLNPLDSDGQGALSAFGLRNPIYRQITRFVNSSFSAAGAGFSAEITDQLSFAGGYLVPLYSASNPLPQVNQPAPIPNGGGLTGGDYAAIAQLTFRPLKSLGFGLTYVRSYTQSPFFGMSFAGYTGSTRAQTGLSSFLSTAAVVPTSANSGGFEFSWNAHRRVIVSGWVGATFTEAEGSGGFTVDNEGVFRPINRGDTSTILNYALTFAFPDLFLKGSMGGLVLGSQPQVIASSINNNTDPDMNFHVEGFYRLQVNDNISITPGVFAVFNPEGNSQNNTVVVGTVRTTFTF